MSALGQKQTSRSEITMSALPPKADMTLSKYTMSALTPKADMLSGAMVQVGRATRRALVA